MSATTIHFSDVTFTTILRDCRFPNVIYDALRKTLLCLNSRTQMKDGEIWNFLDVCVIIQRNANNVDRFEVMPNPQKWEIEEVIKY